MPTYSYICTKCSNYFKKVQSFNEDSLTSCPKCLGKLRKLFNSVGIVFKGSGFYRNDNRLLDKNSSKTIDNSISNKSSNSSSMCQSSNSSNSSSKKTSSDPGK